jgi:6-pyruvoyltetrahydropterin/6-carboxytetrahydropterin synthase
LENSAAFAVIVAAGMSQSMEYDVAMPFAITTTRHFSAAHQLRLYDGSLEPLHGHNWKVKVTVSAQKLDEIGVVMDFHELERLVNQIIEPMHNRNLNDLTPFKSTNPSAENVVVYIAEKLHLPKNIKLESVEVWETEENSAVFLNHQMIRSLND